MKKYVHIPTFIKDMNNIMNDTFNFVDGFDNNYKIKSTKAVMKYNAPMNLKLVYLASAWNNFKEKYEEPYWEFLPVEENMFSWIQSHSTEEENKELLKNLVGLPV